MITKKVKINQITKESLKEQKFDGLLVLTRLSETIVDIERRLRQANEERISLIKESDRHFKNKDFELYEAKQRDLEYTEGHIDAYENSLDDIRQLVKMLKCYTFEEGYYVWGDMEPSIDRDNEVQASEGEFELEWEEI